MTAQQYPKTLGDLFRGTATGQVPVWDDPTQVWNPGEAANIKGLPELVAGMLPGAPTLASVLANGKADAGIGADFTGAVSFGILPGLPAQAANTFLRGPAAGPAGVPTFGLIARGDLPAQTVYTDTPQTYAGAMSLAAGNSLSLYNTADQTTNYERLRLDWLGNVAQVRTNAAGTGAARDLKLSAQQAGGAEANLILSRRDAGSPPFVSSSWGSTGTAGNLIQFGGTMTGGAGTQTGFAIANTYNQTGAAGAADLLINRTETAIGTGTQRFAEMQINGAAKYWIDRLGNVAISPTAGTQARVDLYDGGVQKYQIGKQTDNSFFIYDVANNRNIFGGTTTGDSLIGSSNGGRVRASGGTYTGSAGVELPFAIQPVYNQTLTAGATDFLVNRTETAIGTGAHKILDLQRGGVSQFSVDRSGVAYAQGSAPITSNPPNVSSNTGWKLGFYGFTYAMGVAPSTLATRATGWVSTFNNVNPAGDASGTIPDSASTISLGFGTNGGGKGIWFGNDTPLYRQSALGLTFGTGAGAPVLSLDGGAGNVRDIAIRSGGVNRWLLRTEATAETGADAGSNFQIVARHDDGSIGVAPMTIVRSSGQTTHSAALTAGPSYILGLSGTISNASSSCSALNITPTYAQTGTAGSADILINRTNTALGSGAHYFIECQSNGVDNFRVDRFGIAYVDTINSNSGGSLTLNPRTLSGGAGAIDTAVKITPTYNQTGTAAGTDLLINRTSTALGTGNQRFIDAQSGGVSRFYVDNVGQVIAKGRNSTLGDLNNAGVLNFNRGSDGSPTGAMGYMASGTESFEFRFSNTSGAGNFVWHTNVNSALAERMRLVGGGSLGSGTDYGLKITPTYAQTGATLATDLLVNRTEISIGTGTQRLIDLQTSGVTKFNVDRLGNTTVNGNLATVGLNAGFQTAAPSLTQAVSGFFLPRNADLTGNIIYDYQDELAFADRRGTATVTSTDPVTSGIPGYLFRDDSSSMQWTGALNPFPVVIEADLSANPIAANGNGGFNVGLTFRSSGATVATPNHVKIEFWDNSIPGYATVYDAAVTIPGSFTTWLSPLVQALTGSGFAVPKIRITLTGNASLGAADAFRIERVILYHATANYDPWHLHTGGGTVYGAVTMFPVLALSTGIDSALKLTPKYSQTGSAGSTDLLINRTETALGTGSHKFADFQVGGATKAAILNSGTIQSPKYDPIAGGNVTINTAGYSGTTAGATVLGAGTYSGGAGATQTVVAITPIYNQTSTAAATDLKVNRTENTIGTGTQLFADFQTAGVSKFNFNTNGNFTAVSGNVLANGIDRQAASNASLAVMSRGFTAAGTAVAMATGTHTHSTGVVNSVAITPVHNQTGTAAATDLLINRTQTAVGTGVQNLLDAQVGGVSKLSVNNLGLVTAASDIKTATRFVALGSNGVSTATFTTTDGKTVTITGGIVTSVV